MGEVKVRVELENFVDRENVRRGLMAANEVRSTEIDIIVDTGASQLVLPEDIVELLGLAPMGTVPVIYADARVEERPLAGIVTVRVEGRHAEVQCVVGRPGTEPLLGQVVLEVTDLLVDCANQRLVPDPKWPHKPHYRI